MKSSSTPFFALLALMLAGCPPSAPATVDAGDGSPAAPVVDAGPAPSETAVGVGRDTAPIDLMSTTCPAPKAGNAVRVCGQALVTRTSPDGKQLLGLAASLDGVTLFGLKEKPATREDIERLGAPGQDAKLVQTETDADGRFDVEMKSPMAAHVLCMGRVLQTTKDCALINVAKDGSVAVSAISSGKAITWATHPENALGRVPWGPAQ